MAAARSVSPSPSRLNCGLRREPEKRRTSTSVSAPASRRQSTSSAAGRVPWPIVKTLTKPGLRGASLPRLTRLEQNQNGPGLVYVIGPGVRNNPLRASGSLLCRFAVGRKPVAAARDTGGAMRLRLCRIESPPSAEGTLRGFDSDVGRTPRSRGVPGTERLRDQPLPRPRPQRDADGVRPRDARECPDRRDRALRGGAAARAGPRAEGGSAQRRAAPAVVLRAGLRPRRRAGIRGLLRVARQPLAAAASELSRAGRRQGRERALARAAGLARRPRGGRARGVRRQGAGRPLSPAGGEARGAGRPFRRYPRSPRSG